MTPTEPATKTVTIIGSTGLIGSQLVRNLTAAGHRIVEVSQETRADVLTGEGLDEALAGSDVVIDVVNSATPDDSAQAFFEQTSANLSGAAAAAGVGHYVVLSIVGADLVAPVAGYMRGKLAQEAAAAASGLPWTIVRSTQFHELAEGITDSLIAEGEARVPVASVQTIASAELVEILAGIATGTPLNEIREVGGPQRMSFADLVRTVLSHQDRDLDIVEDPTVGYFGLPIEQTTLVPGEHAQRGTTTLTHWLANR
ncbi:NAD(P)H-binding protein [Aquihabitans sp. G128]|uniref:SDR family oxidoreductase n=1 Tax=Aquihabitans sp. G128 TaxID=2849779 RepID=UPI001C24F50A|nr:NAD(P)H-binding protein [Aquihabitans sp. G128]QXC61625.1 NAD(P)H-binding protein [Aquihabitans sp. G128]